MKLRNVAACLAVLCLLAPIAIGASVPLQLSHQGRLLDSDGDPVDVAVQLTFRIFDDSTGGTQLWEEVHPSVEVDEGLFSVQLGTITVLSRDIFANPSEAPSSSSGRFLELQVASDAPIAPRTRLVASPFSVAASRLAGDAFTDDKGMIFLGPTSPDTAIKIDVELVQLELTSLSPLGTTQSRRVSPSGDFMHDSFFDIDYRVDYQANSDSGAYFGLSATELSGPSSHWVCRAFEDYSLWLHTSEHASHTAQSGSRVDNTGSHAFHVDSFFDIEYRIEFSASDTGSVRSGRTLGDLSLTETLDQSTPYFAKSLCLFFDPTTGDTHSNGRVADSLGSHSFQVDSFFDVVYRIEFENRDSGSTLLSRVDDASGNSAIWDSQTDLGHSRALRRVEHAGELFEAGLHVDTSGTHSFQVDSFFDIDYRIDLRPLHGLHITSSEGDSAIHAMNKSELIDKLADGSSKICRLTPEKLSLSELPSGATIPIEIVQMNLESSSPIIAINSPDDGAGAVPRMEYTYDSLNRLTRIVRAPSGTSIDSTIGNGSETHYHTNSNSRTTRIYHDGLELRDASSLRLKATSSGTIEAASSCLLALDPPSTVTMGAIPPSAKLTVNGDICATGLIGPCSDRRYKKNFAPISDASEIIQQLDGVRFDWRIDEFEEKEFSEDRQVGFIAQDVRRVLPEIVLEGKDGYFAVDYGRLAPVLVEAIKDQNKTIDELRLELELLKQTVQQLTNAMQAQEKATYGATQTK